MWLYYVVAGTRKDHLCLKLFRDAGYVLGRHITALLPKVDKEILSQNGGLDVVCVGRVWKSWNLLKEGFLEGACLTGPNCVEMRLMTLTVSSSIGAAALAAKKIGIALPLDYASHVQVLYQHKK